MKDDVEAVADQAAGDSGAGGHEVGLVAQLDELRLWDAPDAHADQVEEDVVVLLENTDGAGIADPPLPGFAVVVPVLATGAAELPVSPASVGKRVAAFQAVRYGFIQVILHDLPVFG